MRRVVHGPAPTRPPSASGVRCPSRAGALAALGRLATDGLAAANRTNGPADVPLRHRRRDTRGPGRRLADQRHRPERLRWVNSPLASRLEQLSIDWLKDLFGLPATWGGVLTTGATMANFSALAAARHWYGERYGLDIEEDGLGALPHPITVLTGGYLHTSAAKAIAMLGIGRGASGVSPADPSGRIDLDAVEDALRDLDGRPVILAATAGDVDTGAFDPIRRMADLADRYRAWLHVDGAFGLFAGVSPTSSHLVDGIDGAHSVIADGHKWLNVPYDCGFAFVRDPQLLARTFAAGAAYLPRPTTRARHSATRARRCHGERASSGLGHPRRVRPAGLPRDGRASPGAARRDSRPRWTPRPTWSDWPRCH